MLMMVGPVMFRVAPFNLTEYSHTHGGNFVEKPVMGARQPLEWTGQGTETWNLNAKLFPERFGGSSSLAVLSAIRASGLPQFMLRGDGSLMGWVVVESVTERATMLASNGVGKVIDVTIGLKRSQAPTPAGYIAALSGLFSGVF
jgi:phage protein U